MKKYFFSDLDGTLLHNQDKKLLPHIENVQAIQEFVNQGNSVVFATGRGYADIQRIANNMGITDEYAIAWNGAFIFKNGREVFAQSLSVDRVNEVKQFVKKSGIPYNYMLLCDEDGKVYLYEPTWRNWIIRQTLGKLYHKKYYAWNDKTIFKLLNQKKRLVKVLVGVRHKADLPTLEEQMRTYFGNKVAIFASATYTIEICDTGVSKAAAIEKIMQREDVAMADVAFVGDSGNDVAALEFVQNAYVMAHAIDRYKPQNAQEVEHVYEALQDFQNQTEQGENKNVNDKNQNE